MALGTRKELPVKKNVEPESELVADSNKRKSKKEVINEKLEKANKSLTRPTNPITRSNKRVVYLENNLDELSERKRDAHGTAINVPLYVEEFRVLEALYEKEREKYNATSFVDFLRKYLASKVQIDLGKKAYDEIMKEKLNQKTEDIVNT